MTSNQIQVFSSTFIFNDLKSLLVLRNSCTDMYLLLSEILEDTYDKADCHVPGPGLPAPPGCAPHPAHPDPRPTHLNFARVALVVPVLRTIAHKHPQVAVHPGVLALCGGVLRGKF